VNAELRYIGLERVCVVLILGAATPISLTGQTLTTLFTFDVAHAYPSAELVQGIDGNLYGTTYWGGAFHNYGSVSEAYTKSRQQVLYYVIQLLRSRRCQVHRRILAHGRVGAGPER
jgi:hypothetical protein